jgi:membrane fusion protein, heavy metal efflux system
VSAPLAGQLALAPGKDLPLPGARVQAGDVLALLQPHFSDAAARFVEIESEAARSEAVLKQSEAAYERVKRLVAAQARSERELEEAEVALLSARARHSAALALRSTYTSQHAAQSSVTSMSPMLELRAPTAGIVTTVSAGIGQPVTAGQVLFTVLNPETLWIEAQAPEAAIARLDQGKEALVEVLDGGGRFFSFGELGGHLVFSGLEVNPVTRTVPLIYEVNNQEARLRVGQTVRLHVETATAQSALAIPDAALVEEGGLFVAFVQVAGETFQKRELQLGIRDGQWIQVLSGIKEGERVVTRGAYAIRLASVSAIIPAHGHTH